MTTKHTEGPWKVVGLEAIYNNKGQDVAHVIAINREVDDVDDYEMQANAHLIAAAPELLGALTTLNIYLPDILKTLSGDFKDHPIFELVKIAEKSIAKAKGEL